MSSFIVAFPGGIRIWDHPLASHASGIVQINYSETSALASKSGLGLHHPRNTLVIGHPVARVMQPMRNSRTDMPPPGVAERHAVSQLDTRLYAELIIIKLGGLRNSLLYVTNRQMERNRPAGGQGE